MGVFYYLLDPLLSPLLFLGAPLVVLVVAVVIRLIQAWMKRNLWDMQEIKRTQLEMVHNLRYLDPEHRLRAAKLDMKLKRLMVPNFLTIAPISIIFSWARVVFGRQTVINLPYTLPFFGNDLGWIGWFIFCSAIVSTLMSKVLKI